MVGKTADLFFGSLQGYRWDVVGRRYIEEQDGYTISILRRVGGRGSGMYEIVIWLVLCTI